MFFVVLVLNIFVISGLFAVDPGYYKESSIMEEKIYFPKSDTEYIDYLTKVGGTDANYELAIAHLKLERKKTAEKYIKLYEKEEGETQKLLNFYRLAEDYEKVDQLLEKLLKEVDEDTKIKYKVLIENETKAKNLPIDLEKYKVSKVEKLYILKGNDEKFKEYFNSEKWTNSEMKDLLKMLKNQKIPRGGSVEKLFDMFATDRDKLHKKYIEIDDIDDERGYNIYFDYAEKLGVTPELKSQNELDYYLKYKGKIIEIKNINTEIAVEADPRKENQTKESSLEEDILPSKSIENYEQDIKLGKLEGLDEYIDLLKLEGEENIEDRLKKVTREAYVAYRVDRNLSIEKGDMELGATYLFGKNDLIRLEKYKDYLTEEQLGLLSITNRVYRDYYREKYPLNTENIDRRRSEYFYFAENPNTKDYIITKLQQKRHLEPQEKYYLAMYYYSKGDYIKSYRETEQLFRRYQLSDKIFNLHASSIGKIKSENIKKNTEKNIEELKKEGAS